MAGFTLALLIAGASQSAIHLRLDHGAARGRRPESSGAAPTPTRFSQSRMEPGESLSVALRRAGLSATEADTVAHALADDFDGVNPHPGLRLNLATRPSAEVNHHLVSLDFEPRENDRIVLTRGPSGGLTLSHKAALQEWSGSIRTGHIDGSLYLSIVEAGASPEDAAAVVRGFGRRLDLARDVSSGAPFTLMFNSDGGGRPGARPRLIFAGFQIGNHNARLYRFTGGQGGDEDWRDDMPGNVDSLLRTPLDAARLTSGFGMRTHPLLGYSRMHQGLDFGAPTGTPVLAAADGTVEEVRWSGGYGRWLKVNHGDAVETAYAHLSGWASGVTPGVRVRQGQVIAYVGTSGLATGPHLHYEVISGGHAIDPRVASRFLIRGGDSRFDPLFRVRKANIDAEVARLAVDCAPGAAIRSSGSGQCIG